MGFDAIRVGVDEVPLLYDVLAWRSAGDDGRSENEIRRSLNRLPLYKEMDTIKIDTTHRTLDQVVSQVVSIVCRASQER